MAVEGKNVENYELDEIFRLVLGPADTPVAFAFAREVRPRAQQHVVMAWRRAWLSARRGMGSGNARWDLMHLSGALTAAGAVCGSGR